MTRSRSCKLLSAAVLSLLTVTAYPALRPESTQLSAQAQQPEQTDSMTLARLEAVLREEADNVQGGAGQWQMAVGGRPAIVLADVTNNRMRIVSPVVATSELDAQSIQNILLANFHTALDARYAISDNVVISVFVHPLSSLTTDDLRSAISQVPTLADTFGTTYSSEELDFGPSSSQATPEPSLGI